MNRLARRSGFAVTVLIAAGAGAQTTASHGAPQPENRPSLQHRSTEQDQGAKPVVATGHTDLPPGAEGEYPWGPDASRGNGGNEIEIYFEDGKLQGYMTQRADPRDEHSTPITFDFSTTQVHGDAVAWTTRVVHGRWYSFRGHLERGLVADPASRGYYVLTGTVTEHDGPSATARATVRLNREPQAGPG